MPGAHPGQVGQSDTDPGKALIIKPGGHLHRLKTLRGLQFFFYPVDIFLLKIEQLGQPAQCRRFVLQSVRNDVDPEIGAIGRNRLANPVDKPAAPRRNQRQVDPVAF